MPCHIVPKSMYEFIATHNCKSMGAKHEGEEKERESSDIKSEGGREEKRIQFERSSASQPSRRFGPRWLWTHKALRIIALTKVGGGSDTRSN